MSIHVSWFDDEQTTLFVQYMADWTLEEFINSANTSYEMMESVTHEVDIIQDLTRTRGFPTRLISSARHIENRAHPRRRYMIFIGLPAFLKQLIHIASMFAPKASADIFYCNTLDEARTRLDSLRAALSSDGEPGSQP